MCQSVAVKRSVSAEGGQGPAWAVQPVVGGGEGKERVRERRNMEKECTLVAVLSKTGTYDLQYK